MPIVTVKLRITKKIKERFLKKISRGDSCWEWTGGKYNTGYGYIPINRQNRPAHRVSFLIHKGAIKKNFVIRHMCHNRICVNPAHLEQGTVLDNVTDSVRDGRFPTGERHHLSRLNPNSKKIRKLLSKQKLGKRNPMSLLNPNSLPNRMAVSRGNLGKKGYTHPERCQKIMDQNGVIYSSQSDASRKLKINQRNISNVVRGQRPTVSGYSFKRVYEDNK